MRPMRGRPPRRGGPSSRGRAMAAPSSCSRDSPTVARIRRHLDAEGFDDITVTVTMHFRHLPPEFIRALANERAKQPANEPFRIAGNLYYVGATDVSAFLITGPEGHILLDAGYPTTAKLIMESVAKLGFDRARAVERPPKHPRRWQPSLRDVDARQGLVHRR